MDINLDLDAVCLTCLSVSARTVSVRTKDIKYDLTLMAMITSISSNMCVQQLNGENDCKLESLYFSEDTSQESPEWTEENREVLMDAPNPDSGTQMLDDDALEENSKDVPYGDDEYLEFLEIEALDDKALEVMSEDEYGQYIKATMEQADDTGASDVDDDHGQADEASEATNIETTTISKSQCMLCNRVLSKPSHLKRHMLTHSRDKRFKCTICSKSFGRLDILSVHMLIHGEQRPYSCDICNKSFKRDEHLKTHLLRHHKSSNQIDRRRVCSTCCRVFATEANLKKHMEIHSEKESFICGDCGKQFINKYYYMAHCREHAKPAQSFPCSECGKSFKRKEYFTAHMRRHRGENPYMCRYCEKAFPRSSELNVHEKYHTNKKNHHCTLCDKSFFRLCSLKLHQRIHTGEKPYKCPHCPKQFIQRYDMQIHVRRHTGERFQCDQAMCNAEFIYAFQLDQHAQTVHGALAKGSRRNLEKFSNTNTESVMQVEYLDE
ncbi:zinc finger protein 664-like [Anopheles ziemanni]|uniref:zinc finger protein 664-like n=1 Tax=Anopheles ziemanni TaxID=345580 RepID=UPI00265E7F0E|nr:zinc finger protein 664-like [Anopheles ziemanni]